MGTRAKLLLGIGCAVGVSFFSVMAFDVLHEGEVRGVAKPTAKVRRLLPQAARYLESRWAIGGDWQLFCAVRYLGDSRERARINLYVWEACQSYRARDNRLADFTGWSVPAAITFGRTSTGFQVVNERQAGDGDYYWPSIRKIFPAKAVQEIQRLDREVTTVPGTKEAMFADLKRRARQQLLAQVKAHRAGDPPLLVPWTRVGDIALGEPRARVEREYGTAGHGYHVVVGNAQGYYLLHGSKVWVTFATGRVEEISFSTPYYRTKSGFGVGNAIPLGPCHRTAKYACEHRWHGFVWNEWKRDKPCSCWTKAGLGAQSLPLTTANFLKPWFFINMRHGRVHNFYFAWKFVD